MSLFVALFGRERSSRRCRLIAVERTLRLRAQKSETDPNRWGAFLRLAQRSMAASSADGSSGYRYERKLERGTTAPRGVDRMEVVDLVLPVFAVIVTGWLAGQLGYLSRSLA